MASSGADLLTQGAEGAQSRSLIDSLTGMRALAALWVLALHFSLVVRSGWLSRFAEQGRAGVSLFFVLSGIVLTLNYRRWFESDTSRWRQFARARVARIVPMYLFGLLLGTVATI